MKKKSTKDLMKDNFFEELFKSQEEKDTDISPAQADIEEYEREEKQPKVTKNDKEENFDRSLNEKMFQTPSEPEVQQDALAELEKLLNMRRK